MGRWGDEGVGGVWGVWGVWGDEGDEGDGEQRRVFVQVLSPLPLRLFFPMPHAQCPIH